MPVNITVTKRGVKNQRTGIDMSVPSHTSASSPKQVKDYHVVVITTLPHFKRPEHSAEDVVQFMVPRDYAAFERLQKEILEAYPELKFPDLPRKFHLFVSQTDIEDRQIAFDCLVRAVAKNKELCCSSSVLRFLGFDLLADVNYHRKRREFLQKRDEQKSKEGELFRQGRGGEAGKEEEEGEGGLFEATENGDSADLFLEEEKTTTSQPFAATSLFDEGEDGKRSAKILLGGELDDQDDGELFVPKEARTEVEAKGDRLFETEDNSELLNVSESIEDVLKIAADSGQSKKPTKKPLSAGPSGGGGSKGLGLFEEEEGDDISGMGTDDIMKYIQQNTAGVDDDLDLF